MSTNNRLSNIVVNVEDVAEIIQGNRDAHRVMFEEAMEGFTEAARSMLSQQLANIQHGRSFTLAFGLPVPEDHTADYDRVLAVLKLTLDAGHATLTLDEHEQAMYLMDDWSWKRAFIATASTYSE